MLLFHGTAMVNDRTNVFATGIAYHCHLPSLPLSLLSLLLSLLLILIPVADGAGHSYSGVPAASGGERPGRAAEDLPVGAEVSLAV